MRRQRSIVVVVLLLAGAGVVFYMRYGARPPAPPPAVHPRPPVYVASRPAAEEAWVRGNQAMEAEQFDDAISAYDESLRDDPSFALALVGRGNARLALQEYDSADADFTAALKLNPDLPDAYLSRGTKNWLLGRLFEAKVDFRKLTEMYPDNSFYARRLANVLYESGKAQEVEKLGQAAYERNHDNQWALGLWFEAMLTRSPDDVIQQGQSLLDSGVDVPALHDAVGEAYLRLKPADYSSAIVQLAPLMTANVTEVSTDTIQDLAVAYARTGQMAECESTLQSLASRLGRPNQVQPQFCETAAQS